METYLDTYKGYIINVLRYSPDTDFVGQVFLIDGTFLKNTEKKSSEDTAVMECREYVKNRKKWELGEFTESLN